MSEEPTMRRYIVHLANGQAKFAHGHSKAQAMAVVWNLYHAGVYRSPPITVQFWE